MALNVPLAVGLAALLVLAIAILAAGATAMLSLGADRREEMARSSRAVDKRVIALLARPRWLMTTTLIGTEAVAAVLVVVVLGVCAQLAGESSPTVLLAIALAIGLPVVVLVAKVLPQTLALKSPIAWARATGGIIALVMWVLWPVRVLLVAIASVMARPLVAGGAAKVDLSEEEFRHMIDAGSVEGQVDARERRLIHRVFEFSDKDVGQVMTPRDKIFALAYDLPMSRLSKEVAARGFSRVPIFQKSLDNIRGILQAKDLVRGLDGPVRQLADLLHEPLFVPRTTPIKRLFLTFQQRKVHMALVVDEYGHVLGVVTMDDLLEQIFGAIRDEREIVQGTRRRERGGRIPMPGPGVETGPVRTLEPSELEEVGEPRSEEIPANHSQGTTP